MSLVPLERVTYVGMSSDMDRLLDDLHTRGCLELIPLNGDKKDESPGEATRHARDALLFLLTCPQRRRQVSDDSRFDPVDVERRALALRDRIQELDAERDELTQRIKDLKPWGAFQFPPSEQLGDLRLWFYVVPHKQMPQIEASGLVYEVVRREPRLVYVVVVSKTEPSGMPVQRVRMGSRSLEELSRRLEEVELSIEDSQAERAYLTRWCLLLARDLDRLDDQAEREKAALQTCQAESVFGLQAWAPVDQIPALREYAERNRFMFEHAPPASGEQPPTLMHNRAGLRAGEDLVNFYMTPGYWTWDPSPIVFISFAIFFAMIMADAGYAAVLGVGLLVIWKKLGGSDAGQRFQPMLALIVVSSLVYGVLVGSYFGLTPPKQSFLGRMHVLDMNNAKLMMGLSVFVGGLHVILANVMDARRYAHWRDSLASIGWATAVLGGLLFAASAATSAFTFLKPIGGIAAVGGLLLVLGYTAPHEKPLQRFMQGMLGLTKISAAFGDILSYLRLFALGLASASLAVAFNDMAAGIRNTLPRFGLLFALLVLLLGHTLNLLLGISSGVIHGLRLNVIEFFNWGLKDEGRRFTPFQRKEGSSWNRH